MAYASQSGRARTSTTSPEAFAVCDRCGAWENWKNLSWQFDWRGASLINIRLLVCNRCYDTPQEQLRAIVVPADPTPIINARTENFLQDETNYSTISAPTVYDPTTGIPIPSTITLVTQDNQNSTNQPIGVPVGLTQGAVMPLNQAVHYAVPVPVLSISANGTTVITVTCSKPHGLSTNAQISVEALANNQADGFYSIIVTTATAFTYATNNPIPTGALLTSMTNMLTALVGLPLGYDVIPQVGG